MATIEHMKRRCILTGVVLTPENDSKVHVVPSALGGRLKPKGILCNDANETLNDKIDLPLVRAFQPIMTLLGGSRDRGENPPIRMTDETGRAYDVAFGEYLSPANPDFSMIDTPGGGVQVSVSARTRKELRTLLGQVKKRFPEFDIEEAVQRATVARPLLDGPLHGQLQIGPVVTFPAAFAAASIFAVHHGLAPHPDLKTYVASLDPEDDERPMPPDTFYWHAARDWFETEAEVSHILALIGDAAAGRMLAYIEYFNVACIAVVLPYAGDFDLRATHAVDVLEGREAPVRLNEAVLAAMPWSATHMLGDRAHYADVTRRMNRVLEIVQRGGRHRAIEDIFNKTVGPVDGRMLTDEEKQALASKLAEFVAEQIRRP
jgi:hypothetical protein